MIHNINAGLCTGGSPMKNTNLLVGVFSLVAAGLLYLLDITVYTWQIGSGTMKVYPAAGVALLGSLLIFRALTQYRRKKQLNN